jgi:hypothetical protein
MKTEEKGKGGKSSSGGASESTKKPATSGTQGGVKSQSTKGGKSSASGSTKNKRKFDPNTVDDDTIDGDDYNNNEIKINLLQNLKKQLIVDWENICSRSVIAITQ